MSTTDNDLLSRSTQMATEINDHDLLTSVANGGANVPRDPANYQGGLFFAKRSLGRGRRMSTIAMSYRGVALELQYLTNGLVGPEACCEDVITVEANGADITPIFSEEQLGELRERIEASWEMEAQS